MNLRILVCDCTDTKAVPLWPISTPENWPHYLDVELPVYILEQPDTFIRTQLINGGFNPDNTLYKTYYKGVKL